jgi:hypothetical protein
MMKLFKDAQGEVFAYELDGSQDHLIGDKTPITAEEAAGLRAVKEQAQYDALSYAEKRVRAYPSITEQLDILYHQGFDAWKEQIKLVKDLYPKP